MAHNTNKPRSMGYEKRNPFSNSGQKAPYSYTTMKEEDKVTVQDNIQGKEDSSPSPQDTSFLQGFQGIADSRGRLQFASGVPIERMGYTEEDILAKPFWEAEWFARSRKSKRRVQETLQQAMMGKSRQCQVEAFTKEGESIPVTFTLNFLKGRKGDIISIVTDATPLAEDTSVSKEVNNKTDSLHALLDNAQEIIIEMDSSEHVTYINPSCRQTFGWESSMIVGTKALDYFHPEDATDMARTIELMEDEVSIVNHQVRIRIQDGSYRPMVVTYIPPSDSGMAYLIGSVTCVAGDLDGTSDGKFHALFEFIPYPAFVMSTDGVLIEVNKAFCETTGYLKTEIEGVPLGNQNPELELIPQEEMPKALALVMKGLAGEESPAYELKMRKKSGEFMWVELNICPITEKGQMVGGLGIARDITEHIHAQGELERKERYLKSLVNEHSDAISVIDRNGNIAYRSPSFECVVGFDPEEQPYQRFYDRIHPDDIQQVTSTIIDFVGRQSFSKVIEIRAAHADGSWHTFQVMANNLLEDPNVGGILISFRDITMQEQTEEQQEALTQC
ncbi:MAG: PAS domain S-box protein [Chloroflexota bacterium]|nr:PAS domain S-box protein [Chloroflexota bacterium]